VDPHGGVSLRSGGRGPAGGSGVPLSPRVALVAAEGAGDEEERLLATLSGLLERGWDSHLVLEAEHSYDHMRRYSAAESRLARRIHRTVVGRPPLRARLRGVRRTDALLRALGPRILHFTSTGPAHNHARLAQTLGARTIIRLSADAGAPGGNGSPGPELGGNQRDLIEVPDEWVRARLQSNGRPGPGPIEVVGLFAAPDFLLPSGRVPPNNAGPALRALSVGPLGWEAGYEYAIQAIALLRARKLDVEWRVLGAGPYAPALRFAAHQLGVDDLIRFEQPRGGASQRHAMAWADVVLAPSLVDGLRQSVVDAWAMALPVVMTGPIPAAVHAAGDLALAVPRRDPRRLAEALAQLADDRELQRRLGRAGRQWVLEHGQLEDHLDRLEAVYRRLCAESARDAVPASVQERVRKRGVPAAQAPFPALEEE
jgi:glycosyltransferase involved in cell wall biosynthesis